MNSLKCDALPIPWSHLVYQAVEQCFVGPLLQFGFRVCSPCRTTSQISCNSPFHLKNIVKKQCASNNKSCWPAELPTCSLLTCQIFPCSSTDEQSPTVLQILNEFLQELQRRTPQSFSERHSQCLPLIDCTQSQASCKGHLATKHASLQEQRASPIYCTPQEFCPWITPLALTGSSQPTSSNIPTQGKLLTSTTMKLEPGPPLGGEGWFLVICCHCCCCFSF